MAVGKKPVARKHKIDIRGELIDFTCCLHGWTQGLCPAFCRRSYWLRRKRSNYLATDLHRQVFLNTKMGDGAASRIVNWTASAFPAACRSGSEDLSASGGSRFIRGCGEFQSFSLCLSVYVYLHLLRVKRIKHTKLHFCCRHFLCVVFKQKIV